MANAAKPAIKAKQINGLMFDTRPFDILRLLKKPRIRPTQWRTPSPRRTIRLLASISGTEAYEPKGN
jgi:hypothetical protein